LDALVVFTKDDELQRIPLAKWPNSNYT
jgi:hypothetical protein